MILIAYYNCGKWNRNGPEDQICDGLIRKLVGRREDGAGTLFQTMERDMVFTFKRLDAAKRALKRLTKKGISAEIVNEN